MSDSPFADPQQLLREALAAGLKPAPDLSLSEWADEHFRLSAESSAVPGRWRTLPYQTSIMDAMSDPRVRDVSLMKSARIGYTLMVTAGVGYYVHHAPCSMLFVEPTVEDAKSFSKETIAPMIRDVPVLAPLMLDDGEHENGPKDSGNTIQGKSYPGGKLSLVGANSGAGFRRRSCKVVILDEIDAYPPSAGSDGDPVKLAKKRSEYFWDRKTFAGSTPLVAGASRIEQMFEAGDQRRYYVPCPHCGHKDYLVFTKRETGGHFMLWDKDAQGGALPDTAHFVCSASGCVIEHKDQRQMIEQGEWRAAKPFKGHASFHIWAAYSYSPGATWAAIAGEFVEANREGKDKLRTFVNTTLGEVFRESGDAPDWERLYSRREKYALGTVPEGVLFLTCGVDVQKDRFVYEVVGWGHGKESWSIDAGVIPADTSQLAEYVKLDALLDYPYPSTRGPMTILKLAIDSGFNTQTVYAWSRTKGWDRVLAVKGASSAKSSRSIVTTPSSVDVTQNGRTHRGGAKVWPLGVDVAKAELYGWLHQATPKDGQPFAPGYCHFPELSEEFFRQLTAEHLVKSVNRRTHFTSYEWHLIPGRENHWLDARVYARAAAAVAGLDTRMPRRPDTARASVPHTLPIPVVEVHAAPAVSVEPPRQPKSDSRSPSFRVTRDWLHKKR